MILITSLLTALNAADRRMDSSGTPSTLQIVVLATSSALTAAFYSVYRSRATTVARLKVSHISAHTVYHRNARVYCMRDTPGMLQPLISSSYRKPRNYPLTRI